MLEDLQLFSMTQKTMDWLARRQSVLAENVANANTPGYRSKDLKPLSFKDTLTQPATAVQATVTNPVHVAATIEKPLANDTAKDRRPEESKPDGNTVLLEEQMEKIGQVKSRYELAASLFQKNLGMIKTAIGRGGNSG